MKTKLDSFERQIEQSADSYRPLSKKERRKLETILDRVRKSNRLVDEAAIRKSLQMLQQR